MRSCPDRDRKNTDYQGRLTESASGRDHLPLITSVCARCSACIFRDNALTALIPSPYMVLTLHVLFTACGHSVPSFFSGPSLFALLTIDVTHRKLHLILSPVNAVQEVRLLVCRHQFCFCASDNTISSNTEMILVKSTHLGLRVIDIKLTRAEPGEKLITAQAWPSTPLRLIRSCI